MMLWPKPPKPERGTARAKRHMDAVAQQPCLICMSWPVELHHVCHDRFAQRRASDFEVLPLCGPCHAELHRDKAAWRERHGPDWGFLALVRATMENANA